MTTDPIRVRVGGVTRLVVLRTAFCWVEREPSGRHVVHLGALLLEQPQFYEREDPKPCTRCKEPTTQSTKRKRARHDSCENTLDVLVDDVALAIEFGVAADLGATMIKARGHDRDRR